MDGSGPFVAGISWATDRNNMIDVASAAGNSVRRCVFLSDPANHGERANLNVLEDYTRGEIVGRSSCPTSKETSLGRSSYRILQGIPVRVSGSRLEKETSPVSASGLS